MDSKRIHVCIVEDDADSQQSLAAMVGSYGTLVESFRSAEDFLDRRAAWPNDSSGPNNPTVGNGCPDCIVCGLRLPGMSGIELQEELGQRGCYVPFIIISAHGNIKAAVRAMRGGAVTFLEKPCASAEIWDAVQLAAKQSAERRRVAETSRRLSTLTDSECQVLNYAMTGMTNKATKRKLGLSLRTIELRRSNIMKKVGAGSFAELIRLAVEAKHPWRGPHTRSTSRKNIRHGTAEPRRNVE